MFGDNDFSRKIILGYNNQTLDLDYPAMVRNWLAVSDKVPIDDLPLWRIAEAAMLNGWDGEDFLKGLGL